MGYGAPGAKGRAGASGPGSSAIPTTAQELQKTTDWMKNYPGEVAALFELYGNVPEMNPDKADFAHQRTRLQSPLEMGAVGGEPFWKDHPSGLIESSTSIQWRGLPTEINRNKTLGAAEKQLSAGTMPVLKLQIAKEMMDQISAFSDDQRQRLLHSGPWAARGEPTKWTPAEASETNYSKEQLLFNERLGSEFHKGVEALNSGDLYEFLNNLPGDLNSPQTLDHIRGGKLSPTREGKKYSSGIGRTGFFGHPIIGDYNSDGLLTHDALIGEIQSSDFEENVGPLLTGPVETWRGLVDPQGQGSTMRKGGKADAGYRQKFVEGMGFTAGSVESTFDDPLINDKITVIPRPDKETRMKINDLTPSGKEGIDRSTLVHESGHVGQGGHRIGLPYNPHGRMFRELHASFGAKAIALSNVPPEVRATWNEEAQAQAQAMIDGIATTEDDYKDMLEWSKSFDLPGKKELSDEAQMQQDLFKNYAMQNAPHAPPFGVYSPHSQQEKTLSSKGIDLSYRNAHPWKSGNEAHYPDELTRTDSRTNVASYLNMRENLGGPKASLFPAPTLEEQLPAIGSREVWENKPTRFGSDLFKLRTQFGRTAVPPTLLAPNVAPENALQVAQEDIDMYGKDNRHRMRAPNEGEWPPPFSVSGGYARTGASTPVAGIPSRGKMAPIHPLPSKSKGYIPNFAATLDSHDIEKLGAESLGYKAGNIKSIPNFAYNDAEKLIDPDYLNVQSAQIRGLGKPMSNPEGRAVVSPAIVPPKPSAAFDEYLPALARQLNVSKQEAQEVVLKAPRNKSFAFGGALPSVQKVPNFAPLDEKPEGLGVGPNAQFELLGAGVVAKAMDTFAATVPQLGGMIDKLGTIFSEGFQTNFDGNLTIQGLSQEFENLKADILAQVQKYVNGKEKQPSGTNTYGNPGGVAGTAPRGLFNNGSETA
jgi:hypothetical protein